MSRTDLFRDAGELNYDNQPHALDHILGEMEIAISQTILESASLRVQVAERMRIIVREAYRLGYREGQAIR